MDNASSLTRKGPNRVWSGYRNMRVPEEIFPEVKAFMEKKKIEYRAQKEGVEIDALEHTTISKDLEVRAKEYIDKLFREKSGFSEHSQTINSQSSIVMNTSTTNSKQRVEEYLVANPRVEFTNTQLCSILKMSSSTLREATRKIAKVDKRFILKPGRPNKIIFSPDIL